MNSFETRTSILPFPALSTERLHLRQLEASDDAAIFGLRSDDLVNRFLGRPVPTAIEETRAFIKKISEATAGNKSHYWAITLKDNPALIGTICIWNYSDDRKTAELGYELSPKHQGKGLMHEALGEVIRFAFENAGLTTLEAYTHRDNLASTRLLLKKGFTLQTGRKDPENNDHIIFSLER